MFKALDNFDDALSGNVADNGLKNMAAQMFADFSVMRDRRVRERIAGSKTGPTGTDHANLYGYINYLKDSDTEVQWALFMPDKVKHQQNGFKVERFEYRKMPAVRFIGQEAGNLPDAACLLYTSRCV